MSQYNHPSNPADIQYQPHDATAQYVVICDGEAVFPQWVDGILDVWTAETVCEFIKEICPDKSVTMQVVTFIDEETKPTTPHNPPILRVLA